MKIRELIDSDIPILEEITIEAFRGVSIDHNIEQFLGGPIGDCNWETRKKIALADDFNASDGHVFVAELDNEPGGYITTRLDHTTRVGLIPNLAVRSNLRGQGIGRLLIEHALSFFRDNGMRAAKIETLDQNPVGQHLYPQCGFHEIARQVHFIQKL